MNIIIADNAGFCFGVERAINMTKEELNNSSKDIYSYGPLIHNPQVVKHFETQGLKSIDQLCEIESGRIIVRSHGIPQSTEQVIKEKGLTLIDCTCPYVKSVHKRVEEFYNKGYNIVIIGDSSHPEIIGINGYCNNEAFIINDIEEIKDISLMDKVCVVSQTTNTLEKFLEVSNAIKEKVPTVEVFNTICNATKVRQNSTAEVAKQVEAMIVIGGYKSSNTIKLYEISRRHCKNVFHVERIEDLSLQKISKFNTIGITAGASTPDWIIKEAVKAMDNLNENEMTMDMLEAIENSFTRIHKGEVLKGKIIFVTDTEVMVNINYRTDGIINRDELSKDPDAKPKDLYKEGDEIDVFVVRVDDGDGNVVLSTKRVDDVKGWEELEIKFNNKDIIEAKVLNAVKGGLTVLVNGINGFIPASHVSANYVTDLNQYRGQNLEVKIIDFDIEKRRVILSRKEVERGELDVKKKEVWSTLGVDTTIEGVVQRLTDFGAFVDIGGVDGLIHISDLSWNRIKHPSEVVKVGDKVQVKVLALDESRNRISLGLKQTVEEPWVAFKKNVESGAVVEGTVVNLLDFGAFVRLNDGVDGLLHVSQISKEHITKPADVLKVGDKIMVKIIDVNEDERRISLSLKDADEDTEELEVPVQEEVEVTIADLIDNK